ncbi:MAG: HPr(Ser) kinase/phosphatase [Gammaproteobacteria bacterium]
MGKALTVSSLYDGYQTRLGLVWVAGRAGGVRALQGPQDAAARDRPFDAGVGHLNLIHPNRIQVLGPAELGYLEQLRGESRAEHLRRVFAAAPVCVVVSDALPVAEDLRAQAEAAGVALFSAPTPDYKVISHLQYYLSGALADRLTLHGVFMEVLGIGVLLTGKSGVGKSELALELISRCHRLIADDAPEFRRTAPDILNGSCPPELSGFLEVRGLGVLDVRAMFGDSVIKPNKNLRLIIHLRQMDADELAAIDRLQGSRQRQTILDVEVPQVTLPVAPGHNLAVLVEGAVRNHILLLKGYNAAQTFSERQQRMILGEDA